MSWTTHLHDLWKKIVIAVVTPLVLGLLYWLQSNLVFASDLEPISEAIKELAEESREQQDEWRCSELAEELEDFYAKQDALPEGERLSQRETDRMEQIKLRMGDGDSGLRCARFED